MQRYIEKNILKILDLSSEKKNRGIILWLLIFRVTQTKYHFNRYAQSGNLN